MTSQSMTIPIYSLFSSNGIEPTRDWTKFLKVEFVVAGGGFHSYYNLQCIKLDKERKYKKKVLCIQNFLKIGSILCWVQFHGYPILDNATLYLYKGNCLKLKNHPKFFDLKLQRKELKREQKRDQTWFFFIIQKSL